MAGETVDKENVNKNADLTVQKNICAVCQKTMPFIEANVLNLNKGLCEIQINGEYNDLCFLTNDDFYTVLEQRKENVFLVNATTSAYHSIHDEVVVEKFRNVSKHSMHLIMQCDVENDALPAKYTKVFMKGPGNEVTMLNLDISAEQMADDEVFKILYITIRLNNVLLFNMQYDKWQPGCAGIDHGTSQKLDLLLPEVYETLKLKDLPLSMEMKFAVESKLINSQFLVTERTEENKRDVRSSAGEVENRISIVCSLIDDLKKYSDKEVGKEFLLIAKFVARNIRALKRSLKSTYDVIPWEEMEFCLANFITCQTKCQEVDVVYKLVMDKDKLLTYLCNFAEELFEKRYVLVEEVLNCKLGKQTGKSKKLPQQDLKAQVGNETCSFAALRKDFYLIKNVYSLKRIESYLKVALSVNLDEKPELGKLVIERTLQIIGEYLKNKQESRNVSNDVHDRLLFSAPKNVCEIITGLRDSLSHVYTLTKKIEFEGKGIDFFRNIQNDLQKIAMDTGDILYRKKLDVVILFLREVSDAEDMAHVSKLVGRLGINFNFGKIQLDDHNLKELAKVKKLVGKLENEIDDQTDGEEIAFRKIREILELREHRLTVAKTDYVEGVSRLRDILTNRFYCCDNIQHFQDVCREHLSNLDSQMQHEKLSDVTNVVMEIFKSVSLRKQESERSKISKYIGKIILTVDFGAGQIRGIGELKDSLKENTDTRNKAKEELERIFEAIEEGLEETDKVTFRAALQDKMKVHDAKNKVIDYVAKILKTESGEEIDDSDFPNESVELLGLKSQVENLKPHWKKIEQLVKRTEESYGKLVKEMAKLQSAFSPTGASHAFEIFLKSMNLKDCVKHVQTIVKNYTKQLQGNFGNRLLKLSSLLSFTDGHLESIQKYMQDKSLQAAVEMLTLDLLEVLEMAGFFADNRLFLDGAWPALLGRSLRNYLAHGDALIDSFELDPALAIVSNALRLIAEGNGLIARENSLIGHRIVAEHDIRIRLGGELNIVMNQEEMFCAAKTGDLTKVQQCIDGAVDILGRDINQWSGLHFAAQGGSIEVLKYFLDSNLSIDCKDVSGKNSLHVAADFGRIDIVKCLLGGENSGIQDTDHVGKSPLHYAAQNNHKQVVIELLKKADINAMDKDKATPLHLSAQNGHKDIVEVLMLAEGCDVNSATDDGRTPLHFAAQNGHKAVVDILLTKAKVDALAVEDWTPMHFSAQNGHLDIVIVLLEEHANINMQTCRKFTPLHYAACNGHRDVVEYLLTQNTCVNAAGEHGMTPLHCAAMNDHNDVVVLLLGKMAKLDLKDTFNRTPVHMAVLHGHKEVVDTLLNDKTFVDTSGEMKKELLHLALEEGQTEIVKVLLHGVDLNDTNENEDTSLHLASRNGYVGVVEFLLENGAAVNAKGNEEWTALHSAAFEGHMDVVNVLLRYKADVNAQTENKWTALLYAASKGHKDIVDALLANKANVTMREESGWTALHYAALHDWCSIVAALSQKIEVDFVGDNGLTPLHAAALNGNNKTVKLLLQKGADINARAVDNQTPLYMAALNGRKDIVEVLLQKGATADVMTKNNDTALHCAARSGHKFIVALLLGTGINVNSRGIDDKTPLHSAASNGHKEIVEMLLKEGSIEVNVFDKDHATPLHLAAKAGHREVVEILLLKETDVSAVDKNGLAALLYAVANDHLDVISLLLDTKGVHDKGKSNVIPLHAAALRGHKDLVSLLCEYADLNVPDLTGYTALHMAAMEGHNEIVEILLKKEAKVDALTKCNWTALHCAAQGGHVDVVKVLLQQKGCDVNAVDNENMTPLHLAAQEGHKQVVDVLVNETVEGLTAQSYEGVSKAGPSSEIQLMNKVTPLCLHAESGHKDAVEVVLQGKAEVDARNANGETPLHLAAQIGHKGIVEVLLNHGADFVAKNYHDTVLHRAVSSNNIEVIQLILGKIIAKFGHDSQRMSEYINAQDSEGDTPLMWAAEKGKVNAVKALLTLDWVDVGVKNNNGMTALHWAVQCSSLEIVLMLVMKGANANDTDNSDNTVLDYVPVSNS